MQNNMHDMSNMSICKRCDMYLFTVDMTCTSSQFYPHLESWQPDIYRHMTSYTVIWRSYEPIYPSKPGWMNRIVWIARNKGCCIVWSPFVEQRFSFPIISTAGHHIVFCGLVDSIRLSANQQMIQLKRIENIQIEW